MISLNMVSSPFNLRELPLLIDCRPAQIEALLIDCPFGKEPRPCFFPLALSSPCLLWWNAACSMHNGGKPKNIKVVPEDSFENVLDLVGYPETPPEAPPAHIVIKGDWPLEMEKLGRKFASFRESCKLRQLAPSHGDHRHHPAPLADQERVWKNVLADHDGWKHWKPPSGDLSTNQPLPPAQVRGRSTKKDRAGICSHTCLPASPPWMHKLKRSRALFHSSGFRT